MAIKKKVIGDELTVSKPKNVVESEGKLEGKSSAWQEFSKHIMTGISYMIPALIMGGLIGAFSQIIPYVFLGISPDVGIQDAMASGDFSGFHYHLLYLAWIMQSFGFTLFSFAIPIFAAFNRRQSGVDQRIYRRLFSRKAASFFVLCGRQAGAGIKGAGRFFGSFIDCLCNGLFC